MEKETYLNIDIGEFYKINISGLFPIYSEELMLIDKIGLKAFLHHAEYDMYEVKRPPISNA